MTDEVLRSALIDAVRIEYRGILRAEPNDLPNPVFSARYRRRMARLLKDPFGYARPQWQKVLRAVAMILLVLGLTFTLLWTNPTTRAWLQRYLRIRRDDVGMDEYSFHGWESPTVNAKNVRPAYVPEGYVETETLEMGDNWYIITYENEAGEWIEFDVISMKQGYNIGFDTDHSTCSEIAINGMAGQLYTAISTQYNNRLILFDEARGFCYYFESLDSAETLVAMAESLSLAMK